MPSGLPVSAAVRRVTGYRETLMLLASSKNRGQPKKRLPKEVLSLSLSGERVPRNAAVALAE
jgi:hypothetical protein